MCYCVKTDCIFVYAFYIKHMRNKFLLNNKIKKSNHAQSHAWICILLTISRWPHLNLNTNIYMWCVHSTQLDVFPHSFCISLYQSALDRIFYICWNNLTPSLKHPPPQPPMTAGHAGHTHIANISSTPANTISRKMRERAEFALKNINFPMLARMQRATVMVACRRFSGLLYFIYGCAGSVCAASHHDGWLHIRTRRCIRIIWTRVRQFGCAGEG